MKLKSLYSFLKWEVRKTLNLFLNFYDYLIWKPRRNITIENLINTYGNVSPFFFVQVGANDGVTEDHLHEYIKRKGWHGILVEPVPAIFQRLKENYKNNRNLILENSAIGTTNGILPFYSIAEYNSDGVKNSLFSKGIDQLGSFDKKTILGHASIQVDFESFIEEIHVPTITLNTLFSKYSVNAVDLLQIDAEGYDFEILINADFGIIRPRIIIFEHLHISRTDYKLLIKKFRLLKYDFFLNGRNTLCVLPPHP